MIVLINWSLSAIVFYIAAYILPGVHLESFIAAFVTSLVLGIFNAVLKPLLILLTLPITLITLGLFTFVIQAILVMLAASIVPGFDVDSFWWALILSLVLTIINSFLNSGRKFA